MADPIHNPDKCIAARFSNSHNKGAQNGVPRHPTTYPSDTENYEHTIKSKVIGLDSSGWLVALAVLVLIDNVLWIVAVLLSKGKDGQSIGGSHFL
ncbi:hypothetical protein H4217_002520 [Coemansia sp. RSA 1939]|nr:hypothetical protein H4217_002520 [Coemansia sp. RSA 1939]